MLLKSKLMLSQLNQLLRVCAPCVVESVLYYTFSSPYIVCVFYKICKSDKNTKDHCLDV